MLPSVVEILKRIVSQRAEEILPALPYRLFRVHPHGGTAVQVTDPAITGRQPNLQALNQRVIVFSYSVPFRSHDSVYLLSFAKMDSRASCRHSSPEIHTASKLVIISETDKPYCSVGRNSSVSIRLKTIIYLISS